MTRPDPEGKLPVSWSEAREVIAVILLSAVVLRLLAPVAGYLDDRRGSLSDDLAEITRNASPTTALMVLAAGVMVATTPRVDLVPLLRTATIVVSTVVLVEASLATVVELTRASGTGVWGRMVTVFGRTAPAVMLAGTGRWLASRVEPFSD